MHRLQCTDGAPDNQHKHIPFRVFQATFSIRAMPEMVLVSTLLHDISANPIRHSGLAPGYDLTPLLVVNESDGRGFLVFALYNCSATIGILAIVLVTIDAAAPLVCGIILYRQANFDSLCSTRPGKLGLVIPYVLHLLC